MIFILFIFIVVTIFSYYGFSNYFFPSNKFTHYKSLENFRLDVEDTIFKTNFPDDSDSLILRKIKELMIQKGHNISMIPPINGYVTQGINESKNHSGIDIVSKKGDQIKAAEGGVVIFSGSHGDLGKTLIISHPYNYFTTYSHCDSLFVKERDIILKGDPIALLGESGKTEGPHLHFEIWHNDTIIDPRKIIKKYEEKDVSTE